MKRNQSRNKKRKLDRGYRSPSIYSRTEQIKEGRSFRWLYFFIFFVLIGLACYLIFFSQTFKINKVTINGTKYVKNELIQAKYNDYTKMIINNNLLTFYRPSFEKRVGEIDGIGQVSLIKKYPSELVINVEEKVPSLAWSTIDKKYLVDNKGILFAEFDEKFKDIPVIYDSKNVPVQIGKPVVPASFCKFINNLVNDFNGKTGTTITRLEVPEITDEIKASTAAGWYALFDTTRTASGELDGLARVISEVKFKKKSLQYVDLRIDNKIFYK